MLIDMKNKHQLCCFRHGSCKKTLNSPNPTSIWLHTSLLCFRPHVNRLLILYHAVQCFEAFKPKVLMYTWMLELSFTSQCFSISLSIKYKEVKQKVCLPQSHSRVKIYPIYNKITTDHNVKAAQSFPGIKEAAFHWKQETFHYIW